MKNKIIIPECWEEMTPQQYKYLLDKVFVLMRDKSLSCRDVLNDFADYLLGRCYRFDDAKRVEHFLMVNKAAELMGWIFSAEDDQVSLNFDTTTNLLPRIGKLVGPQSHGQDLHFGEYRKACWMYNRYTVEHDRASLDGLVGILYRLPAKHTRRPYFNGSLREPFNPHHISMYAARVKNIPESVKWGVYLWFGYFCKHLMEGDFVIDGSEISFRSLFGKNADPDGEQDESLGMTSVLFSLAETRTFGNVNDTDNAPLFQVMLKLLNDDIAAKKLKKK